MKNEEFDRILADLDCARQRKKERDLMKANAEIKAVERETVAYYDGAYDAVKAIRSRMPAGEKTDENDAEKPFVMHVMLSEKEYRAVQNIIVEHSFKDDQDFLMWLITKAYRADFFTKTCGQSQKSALE